MHQRHQCCGDSPPSWKWSFVGIGAPEAFITSGLSTLGDAACVPTVNRSMVGVLNEYVRLAGYANDDLGSTPDLVWLSDWLAQTPMGPLDKRHGSADRELAALITSA